MDREPEGMTAHGEDRVGPGSGDEAGDVDAGMEDAPELEEQADAIADFVEELLERMGIDAIAEPTTHRGHVYVDIVDGPEDDMALLIGRHGQTLDAIQELARTAVGRRLDDRIRVLVDVGDYRKRAEERLVEHAREIAERVQRTGEEEQLDPMNAYERKLVHDVVADFEDLESVSEGVDPDRFVVVRPL
jgi:spoIIIJ-associated protein